MLSYINRITNHHLSSVLLISLASTLFFQTSLMASHAHLNYPNWWKPTERISLTAPRLSDTEARLEAFTRRNSNDNVEKLAVEFFDMIDPNSVIMRPQRNPDFTVMDNWGRYANREDSQVHMKQAVSQPGVRELLERKQYRAALDLYKDNFFERLANPPKGFLLTPRHPQQKVFVEFVHQPDELMDNIVTLLMYRKPQDDETANGIVVKLDVGPPGAVNWTYTPEGYGAAEETLPDDERFAASVYGFDYFFDRLLIAYVDTGDKQYFKKYIEFLDDRAINLWNDIHARGVDVRPGRRGVFMFQHLAWASRNIPGFREDFPAETLARVLMQFWKYNAGTELKIVRGIVTNRQITMYLNEAYAAAVSFPEFKPSQYVQREMVRVVESLFSCDVMPDGSNIEHAQLYNPAVMHAWRYREQFLDAGVMRRHITPAWTMELRDNLVNAARYMMQDKALNGWDWYPMYYMVRNKDQILAPFPPAYEDPIIDMMLPIAKGLGPINGTPNFTSLAWPYMGIYILRTGWDKDADQECYMAAPRPYSTHTWKNNLDIQLFAFGQPLLTAQTEGYGYVRGPGQTNWEKSFRIEQAQKYSDPNRRGMHQWDFTPVFVDGCPQIGHAGFESMPDEYQDRSEPTYGRLFTRAYDTPLPNRWHESEHFNIMEGTYTGPFAEFVPNPEAGIGFRGKPGEIKRFIDDTTQRRQVVLIKGVRLWVIVDRLSSPADHTYDLDWKFAQTWSGKTIHGKVVPGFERDEIAFEPEHNAFVTHDVEHANLSLYMNKSAGLTPKYDPQTNHYGATFAGRGEHTIVTAAYPRLSDAVRLSHYQSVTTKNGAGFVCDLPDGSHVAVMAANTAPASITAGPLAGRGELLVYLREASGIERCFGLGMHDLSVRGQARKLDAPDVEFTFTDSNPHDIVPIYKPLGLVTILPAADVFADRTRITLSHPAIDVDIRYTLDGSDPMLHSPLYTSPIDLDHPLVRIKARAFRKGITEVPQSASATLASSIHRAVYKKVDWMIATDVPTKPGLRTRTARGDGYLTTFTPMNLADEQEKVTATFFEGIKPDPTHDFMVEYSGYLVVPQDGVYTIHAPTELIDNNKDCGYDLRLWLGNDKQRAEWYPATRLQNWGGWSVALKQGAHALRMLYVDQRGGNFEKSGREWPGDHPTIEITGPGTKRQPIPAAWLAH